MKATRFLLALPLVLLANIVIAQHNEPWGASALCGWVNNNNQTAFRFWEYFNSAAGYNHMGSMAVGSVTAGVTFTGIASCDGSVGGRDIWFRIPYSGSSQVSVRITLYNDDTADPIPMRANVYTGTTCTGSGACTLNRVATHCISLDTEGSCALVGHQQYTDVVSTAAGQAIYVQVWADDNDPSGSASVYAWTGTGGSPSGPINDACTTGISITSTSGSAYAGSNFTANGGDFVTLASRPTTCGWNVTDNSVFYYFTPSGSSVTFDITDVSCSYTGCDGTSAGDLQFAVYQAPSTLSNCTSLGSTTTLYRAPCNNGTGLVSTTVSGLTAGVQHILALDGLTGRKCTWSGINMSAILPLTLTHFEGHLVDDGVELTWQTHASSDAKKFIVMRSADGVNFTPFDEVEVAQAFTPGTNVVRYRTLDQRPDSKVSHYRLTEVSQDGSQTLSHVITIVLDDEAPFVLSGIHPNPAHGSATLQINLREGGRYALALHSLTGQTVLRQQHEWEGNFLEQVLSLEGVAPGLYLLEVTHLGTGHRQQARMLVQ